ncbi:FAD-binding oxidoreductase [Thalassospira sp. MA62]|nr:FAD-binding oxidoreductase [Thalassospira sp. MA62]
MSSEILIIGAGMVGIMTALNLAQQGEKVCLIDRAAPGQATSFGNAGVVSPWSITPNSSPGLMWKLPGMLASTHKPLWVGPKFWPNMVPWGLRFLVNGRHGQYRRGVDAMFALCRPSVSLYRKHLDQAGNPELLTDSYYVHAFRDPAKANIDGLDYRLRREKGAELELADQERLDEVEPGLGGYYRAAILIKGQARLRAPGKAASSVAALCQKLGVRIVQAEVADIRREGESWIAQSAQETFQGKKLIVCAGVWSRRLLTKVGLDLPLVAERGFHMEVPDSGIEITHSVMDMDAKTILSSMVDGLRMAGSADFNHLDQPETSWREDLMRRQLRAIFPNINLEKARFWMGQRPSLPDSVPVVSAIDQQFGLFGAFGHSHHGIMMAPMTGAVMANLVLGRTPEIDVTPYRADRFS